MDDLERLSRNRVAASGAPPPEVVNIPTDMLVPLSAGRAAVSDNFQFDNIFDNGKAWADLGFAYTVPWVDGVRRMTAGSTRRWGAG